MPFFFFEVGLTNMEYVSKAVLDTTTGANFQREDLSNTLSVTDGPKRPFTQNAPRVPATNTTHQWNEIALNTAGRNNVAANGPTYAQGNLPPVNAKSPARKSNETCRTGRTAQVTEDMMASFNRTASGQALNLDEGTMSEMVQNALDLEAALVGIEILNQIEWMHISGDSGNAAMEGGETDGLVKWATANGYNVGSSDGNTGTSTTPIAFAEDFVKKGARGAALTMPAVGCDTLLIPPELVPDFAGFVANGAGRPIVQIASGENANLVAGASVGYYNTAYGVLKIEVEPYLSPAYNTAISQCAVIAYNKSLVKHADLVPFGAKPVAVTDTSVKRYVNCVYAQEHRVAKHTFIIPNVKSAV